jgi:hypothetical protein
VHVDSYDAGRHSIDAAQVDPSVLEPGARIGERLCVIGAVSRDEMGWRVPVTDLDRRLGVPPAHRLLLCHLELPSPLRRAWRRSARSEAVDGRVCVVTDHAGGLDIVVDDADGGAAAVVERLHRSVVSVDASHTALDSVALEALVAEALGRQPAALEGIEIQTAIDGREVVDRPWHTIAGLVERLLLTGTEAVPSATRMLVRMSRERVGQVRAAHSPGASEGTHCVLRVLVPSSSPVGRSLAAGLGACREAVTAAGGFLAVEPNGRLGLSIAAHLPALASPGPSSRKGEGPRGRVAVVLADERVRRTVVAALAHSGYDCVEVSSPELLRDGAGETVAFVDAEAAARMAPGTTMIEVVLRGRAPETPFPTLRTPCAVEDIEAIMLASMDRAGA